MYVRGRKWKMSLSLDKLLKELSAKYGDNYYIYMDIDGVIFKSCDAIVEILNEKYGTNKTGQDVTDWNFNNIVPSLTDKQIEDLFENRKFFDIVKTNPLAIKFLEEHRDHIMLVTSGSPRNYMFKRIWFDDYGLYHIPIISVPYDLNKTVVNMDRHNTGHKWTMFVDDSKANLQLFANRTYPNFLVQFREYDDDKNEQREWIKGWNGDVVTSFY